MHRNVKRTLRVRTTETWTITWRSSDNTERPARRTRRRTPKALRPSDSLEGETEHDTTTNYLQPLEKPAPETNPDAHQGDIE